MSKRSESRAAERLQHKQASRQLRQQHQQEEQQQQQQQQEQDTPVETPTNRRELNALKHGSCSETLLLPSESMDDYLAHENRWFKAYGVNAHSPETNLAAELVRAAARADWLYLRADRNYCDIERMIHADFPDVTRWSDTQHRNLQRFMRYRTAQANAAVRQRKNLEDYIKARSAERASFIRTATAEVKLNTSKSKLRRYEEKNKPELTWQEEAVRLAAELRAKGILPPLPQSA